MRCYSPASANANVPPPPYTARTVYDETHRAVNHDEPRIDSVANLSNLIGYFDHPTPASDGSFAICIAGGIGNFIKKALWESIPAEHRPELDTSTAGTVVECLIGPSTTAIGSVFMPFLLRNKETGERMRYVLRMFVLPDLYMPMFISGFGPRKVVEALSGDINGFVFTFKCGDGTCLVQGLR